VRFSTRTPGDLSPNPLAARIEARRGAGLPLCDLTVSNPTAVGLDYPWPAIDRALAEAGAGVYQPDPRGRPDARRAIADGYAARGDRVDPDQIVLCASTSEAYAFLFKLLCDPGDEVLFPAPSYPLFEHLAAVEGVVARSYRLDPAAGWRVDAASVAAAVSPRTRALVVVSPNNPTGSLVDAAALAALAALAARHGLALVGDEVFADYRRDPAARYASVLANDALSFALGGLSKSAGLPQLKLSWIAVGGPPAARAEALARLELIADTFLSVGAPVQRALPALLGLGGQIRRSIQARTRDSRAALVRGLAGGAARLLPADGGWYALIGLPDDVDEERLCLDLVAEDGVLCHPGYFFDLDGAHLVVCTLCPPDEIARGAAALRARLA
jgi:aspartate/methionine/tyrosine aminotransferase